MSTLSRLPRLARSLLILAIVAGGGGCADRADRHMAVQASEAPVPAGGTPGGFAIYLLSRGKGVSPAARETLKQMESLFASRPEGIAVSRKRIGLEGETEVCVAIPDPKLREKILNQVKALAAGVELMNVVAEPCGAKP